MIKYFAKKWLLKKLNELLENLKENKNIKKWKTTIKKIIKFFDKLLDYLEDDQITDKEAESIIEEAKKLIG